MSLYRLLFHLYTHYIYSTSHHFHHSNARAKFDVKSTYSNIKSQSDINFAELVSFA